MEHQADTVKSSDRKQQAIELAGQVNGSRFRKDTGEPYITHCIRVGEILEQCGELDEDVIIVGILHDIVEDVNPANAFLIDIVKSKFGVRVWYLLEASTEIYTHDNYPKIGHAQRKTLSRLRILKMSPAAQKVRLADTIDTIPYIYKCAKKSMDREEIQIAGVLLNDEKVLIDSLTADLIDSPDPVLKSLFHRAKNQLDFNLEKIKELSIS
jgi:(p)ppGpp synthase/HD superfamily hydrolase